MEAGLIIRSDSKECNGFPFISGGNGVPEKLPAGGNNVKWNFQVVCAAFVAL